MAEWIEILSFIGNWLISLVSASDGGVDWNLLCSDTNLKPSEVSASDGGVDWNYVVLQIHNEKSESPLAMAEWIEILHVQLSNWIIHVSASDGGVDWNSVKRIGQSFATKSPLAMAEWIEMKY